ncbi:membrane protein [Microbacterium phage Big4]|nr:membrane protein [Microbacterium phage Big4]
MDKPQKFIRKGVSNDIKSLIIGRVAIPQVVIDSLGWVVFVAVLGMLLWGAVTDNFWLALPAISALGLFILFILYQVLSWLVGVTIQANKKDLS